MRRSDTALERLLAHDVWLVISGLAIVCTACWLWIVTLGRDMYGSMTGAAAWMMPPDWDATHLALLVAMWGAMMTGMMLPSAAPTLLLYANVVRHSKEARATTVRTYAFGAGYVVVWLAFSVGASILQRALSDWGFVSPMMVASRPVSGGLLILAGAYQLIPFKRACLEGCRSPAAFIMSHWRAGTSGAFRLGLDHGLYCLGCCWSLMLLLFAGGVMNLWVIAAITAFVLLEKVAPHGAQGGRLSGVLLIGAGVWYVVA